MRLSYAIGYDKDLIRYLIKTGGYLRGIYVYRRAVAVCERGGERARSFCRSSSEGDPGPG